MRFPEIRATLASLRHGAPTNGTALPALVAFALLLLTLKAQFVAAQPQAEHPIVDHQIEARLDPEDNRIRVVDQMRLPAGKRDWHLILHSGMDPRVTQGAATLTHLKTRGHLSQYGLRIEKDGPVTLSYGGRIEHALNQIEEGMGRVREWSLGVIGPEGVFLDGNSGWYPRIPDTLQRFQLNAELPEGWTAISQGAGPGALESGQATWTAPHPQDDIYLVAGRFHAYHLDSEQAQAQVYLRDADPDLAQRYLQATQDYIDHYSKLIAPYPFAKFALVENFWETGYGMPSFTLLGPSVIRLPFIIRTSYPHEILHNWWGNSVFVDYSDGNWCEGLTYYLADYWLKEESGQGAEARRDMLKGYADYVREGNDFPLRDFHGKHDLASQDIGYGKSAMVFHMLRRRLGDDRFQSALQVFYRDNQFREASWGDLRSAFEQVSGQDLGDYFAAWVDRTGAPRLRLQDVQVDQNETGYRLSGRISQTQPDAAFPLRIPVVVTQENGATVRMTIDSTDKQAELAVDLDARPTRVAVDPDFDLFRALLPGETPTTLSNLFGAEAGLILVPTNAPRDLQRGYERLAKVWQSGHPDWQVREDDEIDALPTDRPIWILGWENRYLPNLLEDASHFEVDVSDRQAAIEGQPVDAGSESIAVTASRRGQPLAWLATSESAALGPLARKLPHYGKYSYLVFTGAEAANRLKGQWPSGDSDLVRQLTAERP